MKEIESLIQPVFPNPIYMSKLNRELNKKEKNFIEDQKNKTCKNEGGNTTSEDTFILNNQVMKELKDDLTIRVKDYFNKVICTTDNVIPYITQSWLNFNNINEAHHQHCHENSLVSGVFYVNCFKDKDSIIFLKNKSNIIEFTNFKNYNLFNSSLWEIGVRTGVLILFPSTLTHKVKLNQYDHTRISLAFNVFVTGVIGDKTRLTELKV
jgi:uncharacterized protein (TIGR02466 family)